MSEEKKKISVIGVGRLGLCFALVCEHAGYDVLGVDVFPTYVDAINNKTLKSTEPRVEELLAKSTSFRATTSMDEAIEHSDLLFILCATPSTGGERHYDHSTLSRILGQLNARKVANKHICIGCTIIPGYIREVGNYLIRDCTNCSLSYNPEFIAQGDIVKGLLQPDMVLIGEGSKAAGDALESLYTDHTENTPVIARMSASSAEITKLSVNCFVTMKVSYANMIGDACDRSPGADKYEVLGAVGADSRVGKKYLRPGYGFGGPCFPRDNRALGDYMQSVGVKPLLSVATDEYNKLHTNYQADELLASDKQDFVFSDVAYKEKCPVPIIEESQKLEIAKRLARAGRNVTISDRDFIVNAVQQEFGNLFSYQIVDSV